MTGEDGRGTRRWFFGAAAVGAGSLPGAAHALNGDLNRLAVRPQNLAFDQDGALFAAPGGVGVIPATVVGLSLVQAPDATAARAAIGADLAQNVNFTPAGAGPAARTVQDKLRETVSVKDFGAIGDGALRTVAEWILPKPGGRYANFAALRVDYPHVTAPTDSIDWAATQAAIEHAKRSGAAIYAPGGDYRINRTLLITDDITFNGDGVARTTFTLASATVVPALLVACPDNASIIGLKIGNMSFVCNGGPAVCDGVKITTTATNSAVSVSDFHNMRVLSCRRGMWLEGVIYMSKFRNITITTSVAEYGWFITGSLEVIYNSFTNLEVTGVENRAWAYHSNASASQWETITADGCCYFAGAYTTVNGVAVEGIHAATPASTNCIEANQIKEISNVAVINVPNAKCSVGLKANDNINIFGVRFPDRGVRNQPERPVLFGDGATGIMTSVQMENCASRLSRADLKGMLVVGCEDVTDHSLVADGGSWTPTFTIGWSMRPTVIGAQWERHGRLIFATAYLMDGVALAGAAIGGLPVAAASTQGAAAVGHSITAPTKQIGGAVLPSGTAIVGLAANTLMRNYWTVSVTYLA